MRYPVGKDKEDFARNWYNAQGFGAKTYYGYHEGDDFNRKSGGDSDLGQPVYAIADGAVSSLHDHQGVSNFGRHIHIAHDGPWGTVFSHYAHLQDVFVVEGQAVKEGQLIATLGKSGTALAHLHFALKLQPTGVDGIAKTLEELKKWTNPTEFIRRWMDAPAPAPVITDQTKIPQIIDENGNMLEVQAVKSRLNDLARDLKACQTKPPQVIEVIKEVIKPVAVEPSFTKPLAKLLYSAAQAVEG